MRYMYLKWWNFDENFHCLLFFDVVVRQKCNLKPELSHLKQKKKTYSIPIESQIQIPNLTEREEDIALA